MSEEARPRVPRWGYSAADSRIFNLSPDEKLPPGYFDSPAKVKVKKNKTSKPSAKSAEGEKAGAECQDVGAPDDDFADAKVF